MNRLQEKSLRMCSVRTMVLLGLAALGGTAKPALGQDMLQGKFTLPTRASVRVQRQDQERDARSRTGAAARRGIG